ncbi:MAG: class I SAM-dependent methyltransferase [Pseudomonadota bacterium]
MDTVWENLHAARHWGKYPAENLIRTVMRTYRDPQVRAETKILELGCGAGANLSFFLAEGFQTYGIDGAPSAIAKAKQRLQAGPNQTLNLSVQLFEEISFADQSFDLIVDYYAIYANPVAVIDATYSKVRDLLTPNGRFYTRVWGTECTGANTGKMIEPNTSKNPTAGPCKGMGVSHFFTRRELESRFSDWGDVQISRTLVEDYNGEVSEEFAVWVET